MNKTKLALLVLGSTFAFSANANTLQNQVQDLTQTQAPVATIEMVQPQDMALPVSEEAKAPEVVFLKPDEVIRQVGIDIDRSKTETSLDEEAQGRAYLEKEKIKTAILQERATQRTIVESQNKLIAESHKREKEIKETAIAEERKAEEQIIEQQALLAPPVIPDAVSVSSIYGLSNNRFAEIKVNTNKYQVQKGQSFGDGYKVLDIVIDGVKIKKGDVEQFINVSPTPTMISAMPQQAMGEIEPQPNIIKPYELR